MLPWIRSNVPSEPPTEVSTSIFKNWSESTNRVLVHYRYGDVKDNMEIDFHTKTLTLREVNGFLDAIGRALGNITVIILAEDYPGAVLEGVISPHSVFNTSSMAESFWLAQHSTHLLTAESGFSQLLRIAAPLSAQIIIPSRLFYQNTSGHPDTIVASPLSVVFDDSN